MGEVEIPREDRMLDALADVQAHFDRRYHSLAQRVQELEEHNKGRLEEDPTRAMIGIIIAMVVLQVALPLIGQMVAKWQSPS